MVFVLVASRPLQVRDPYYDRAFTVRPNEFIYDPYLVSALMLAGIRMRLAPASLYLLAD